MKESCSFNTTVPALSRTPLQWEKICMSVLSCQIGLWSNNEMIIAQRTEILGENPSPGICSTRIPHGLGMLPSVQ